MGQAPRPSAFSKMGKAQPAIRIPKGNKSGPGSTASPQEDFKIPRYNYQTNINI